ncbi:hypothetical protein ACP70R_043864 [Stipagrostis hirtigluma subsp. patula]
MILATLGGAHVLHPVLGPGVGHYRRMSRHLHLPHAAPRDDAAATEAPAPGGAPTKEDAKAVAAAARVPPPAPGSAGLPKDYIHTLFRSECLEVLGLVDVESLRRRPRLTVGVTVKASVVLPVLVVLAALYVADMAKGVVDWAHLEREDAGD